MNYKIKFYKKDGKLIGNTESKSNSHKNALKNAFLPSVHGTLVTGKTTKAFLGDKQVGGARVFKYGEKGKHGILLLVDNAPFKFVFAYKSKRDEAFTKCMVLMSAKTARKDELLTGIIACLEETSVSKSGSMFQKTLKDYVVSVILPEEWTDTNTDKFSGNEDAKSSEKPTWKNGSELFLSKLKRKTLWAKVIDELPRRSGCSVINNYMRESQGKIIAVETQKWGGEVVFRQQGEEGVCLWMPEWLIPVTPQPQKPPLKVKIVKSNSQYFFRPMLRMIGKTYTATIKGNGVFVVSCEHGTWNFNKSSVEVINDNVERCRKEAGKSSGGKKSSGDREGQGRRARHSARCI